MFLDMNCCSTWCWYLFRDGGIAVRAFVLKRRSSSEMIMNWGTAEVVESLSRTAEIVESLSRTAEVVESANHPGYMTRNLALPKLSSHYLATSQSVVVVRPNIVACGRGLRM